MNKRDYPLFMVDRSKHSTYPFDYITCFDRTVGFVARVVIFNDSKPFNLFIEQMKQVENSEISSYTLPIKRGGIVLVVEDFLYHFEVTKQNTDRIKTLFKKAIKKYLYATLDREPNTEDFNIDQQIKQQQLTIERNRANFDDLVKRSSLEDAKYVLALAEATLETLKIFKENQNIFKVQLN